MPAELIDGVAIARSIREEAARDAATLTAKGTKPGLAVVLVGISLSIPLGTPAMILKARLTIDGRFRELASIGFGSAVVW